MLGGRLLVVVGKPGSGKSTAAATAARNTASTLHFSVGDELRAIGLHGKESALSTELGHYSEELKLHQPVPPDLVTRVFEECITRSREPNIIVDGFPQYANLLPGFYEVVSRMRINVIGVCHISVPDIIALQRMIDRTQRLPDVIEDNQYLSRRLLSYQESTVPAIEMLATRYPVFAIDGSAPMANIAKTLAAILRRPDTHLGDPLLTSTVTTQGQEA